MEGVFVGVLTDGFEEMISEKMASTQFFCRKGMSCAFCLSTIYILKILAFLRHIPGFSFFLENPAYYKVETMIKNQITAKAVHDANG